MVVRSHKFYDCDFFLSIHNIIIMKQFLLFSYLFACFSFCHWYLGDLWLEIGICLFICKSLRSFNKFGFKSSVNTSHWCNTNTGITVQEFGQKWFTCIECGSRNVANIFTRRTRRAIRSHCKACI